MPERLSSSSRPGGDDPVKCRAACLTAFLATVASIAPVEASEGVLAPAGPVGEGSRAVLLNSVAIMMVVVVPTILVALGFAWWFRPGNRRARRDEGFVYSGRIELIVWSIPLLVILFLGGVIWIGSHQLDPRRPIASDTPALTIQVVSLDWKWLFIYPDARIASVNELVVPTGTPLRFRLTSGSVMNAFFVPRLGGMIYTMNGMATELNLLAGHPGRYRGISAHYSGAGFSDMAFTVHAVPPTDFARWSARTAAAGPVLDGPAYAQLARQSRKVSPTTYRVATPGLFDAVVAQRLAPAAGPAADHAATDAPQGGR